MSEIPSKEILAEQPNYEVIDINTDTLSLLRNFVSTEVAKNRKFSEDAERKGFNLDFGWNGAGAIKAVESLCVHEKSFAVIARKKSEIVGFTLIGRDEEDKIVISFVGVEFNSLRQGIATELVRQRHKVLRDLGYREYVVSVWEASKKTIEKATGKSLKPVSDDPDNNDFIVRLD